MGGAGLPGAIFVVVAIVIVCLCIFWVFPWAQSQQRRADRLTEPGTEVLEYEVPEGQDPAAVLTALHLEGLEAVTDTRHGRQLVLIEARGGVERLRPRARAIIAHKANLNTQGDPAAEHDVRFLDE
jgi:hypothetical protein